jgi:hypothetical protein
VTFARAFFDLQVHFAERVAALASLPLPTALLDYTNLYIRFGLGRAFDAAHPAWQEYVAGLAGAPDASEWTHRFAQGRPDGAPAVAARFGCFAYARWNDGRLRLHFQNAEPDGRSPLATAGRADRVADLTALFAHVRRHEPEVARVVGASWLYNLETYRRLFPPAYLATARPLPRRFRSLPLWAQFLDRRGEVVEGRARELRDRVARQAGVEDLEQCFPFQALGLEAPVGAFYDFYGV